jgi:hypothetical protein
MFAYSPLQIAIGLWALVTIVYIALFLYRAIVGAQEEDSLFISAGEEHMAKEQREIMQRINKVEPATRAFGIATAVMTVVVAGAWGYSVFRELF